MSYVHTVSFQVRHYECDAYGQVHYANYLRYMQEAAFAGSAAVGYGEARYSELGYQWLAYETSIEYLAPLTYGETFSVKTWVHDFRRVRSLRRYDFYRDDALVALASNHRAAGDGRRLCRWRSSGRGSQAGLAAAILETIERSVCTTTPGEMAGPGPGCPRE